MRVVALLLLVSGLSASAQELSAPPPPPPVNAPEPLLPGAPPEPSTRGGFTGTFATRVSFSATNSARRYDVSLDGGRQRCKTPCTLQLAVGAVELTTTRGSYALTEELFVPRGETQLRIRPYSPPLLVAGAVLMGVSATALIAGVVLMAVMPYAVFLWLVALAAPALAVGIPGVVLTAVGFNRHSTQVLPTRDAFEAP